MRKTIYVKDGSDWEEIKSSAEDMKMSVSGYLLNAHKVWLFNRGSAKGDSQLDRIEEKIDGLINPPVMTPPGGQVVPIPEPTIDECNRFQGYKAPNENLEAANDRLLKKREENQAELDKNREELKRTKGESNAAWQIRRKVFSKR